MTIGAIIQARMNSSRLPGKVLRPVGKWPLLGHITGRLQQLKTPMRIVVATSDTDLDNAITDWCAGEHIACFRGSETDVLGRYAACAAEYGFSHIIRLTGDNPFTDSEELDKLITLHTSGGYDYNHSFGALPIGVGAEIFTAAALMRSHKEGHALNHREHVNEYIQEHPVLFRTGILSIPPEKTAPALRLTVDTPEDYARACTLAEQANGAWLTTEEAIRLCSHSA